ncbi:MAG: hypothetical protein ACK5MQ_12020 [Pikeienuella sp.]
MRSARPPRRKALALAAAVALAGGPAAADGWSVFGFISQMFEADSNLTLDPDDEEEAIGSTTSLGLDIGTETSRSSFTISPGATARVYSGGVDRTVMISPRLSSGFTHRAATADLAGNFSFDMRPTEFSEIGELDVGAPDLDVISKESTELSLNADLTAGFDIDSRNRFTIGPYARAVRYTDDGDTLSPSTTYGMRSSFIHQVNNRYGLTANLGGRRVKSTGLNRSDSYILDLGGGVRGQISERFTLNGGLGASFVNSEDSRGETDNSVGLTLDADIGYAFQEDLSFWLRASRGIEPSAEGGLQNQTVFSTGLRHLINTREAVDISLGYSSQSDADDLIAGGTDDNQLRADLGYSVALTPEISARIGYAARWVPSGPDEAMSHKIQLTVSRNFTLQP